MRHFWDILSETKLNETFFGWFSASDFWSNCSQNNQNKRLEKHLEFLGKQIILQIWEEERNFHLISSPSSLSSISDLSCYYWDKSVTWGSAIVHMFFLLLLWIGMLEAIQKLQCHKQTSDTRQENQCF